MSPVFLRHEKPCNPTIFWPPKSGFYKVKTVVFLSLIMYFVSIDLGGTEVIHIIKVRLCTKYFLKIFFHMMKTYKKLLLS